MVGDSVVRDKRVKEREEIMRRGWIKRNYVKSFPDLARVDFSTRHTDTCSCSFLTV